MQTTHEALAESIAAGTVLPHGPSGYYTGDEWIKAAQYALDTDDWTEFRYMLAREAAWDRFKHWQQFHPSREWADFDDYCDRYLEIVG